MEIVSTEKIAQGLVLHYGCVDKFIESEDKIEQLSDPNKVTLETQNLEILLQRRLNT